MKKNADWTWMVYMAGDNDLSSAGDADLEQMRAVGSSSRLNLLVEFDNAGEHGTRRIRVGKDGAGEVIEALGETDSGDPAVLLDFVRWARESYPAERYALVLWNHGGGWEPAEIERIARSVRSPDFSPREAPIRAASKLRRTFFRPSLGRILAATPSQRAICSDDGSGHSLDTVELGKALAGIVEALGQPIDLLGMDACLMSNLEVAFEAAPHARVLVASEETEPADGWPYDTVLAPLAADPTLGAAELGAHIVSAYLDSYAGTEAGDLTQTALDLAKITDLTGPLDELARALLAEMPEAATWMWETQKRAPRFWDGTLRDLGVLCRGLEQRGSVAVRAAAERLRAAMAPGTGRAVLAERHRGAKVAPCSGISIYLPFQISVSPYYSEIAFARNTQWPRLLEAAYEA